MTLYNIIWYISLATEIKILNLSLFPAHWLSFLQNQSLITEAEFSGLTSDEESSFQTESIMLNRRPNLFNQKKNILHNESGFNVI